MGGFNSGLFSGTTGAPQLSLASTNDNDTISHESNSSKSQRTKLLTEAQTEEVRNIVSELYREGANIGDGGTADAVRAELATGKTVGGKSHIQKGKERLRQIKHILRQNPNHPDRQLLERLRDDLQNALEDN